MDVTSSDPTVTVIVPVFNKAEYVTDALRSALTQSLRDIEIIVIDDGSEDSSLKVVSALAEQDERIRVVARQNAGVAAARNHGLAIARGKYVAFLDPDDWYPDEAVLEDLVEAARQNHLPIAGGSAERFVGGRRTQDFPRSERGYLFAVDGTVDYSTYQFDYGFWRFVYERSFLIDNGILFPPYRRYQDPPFFVRAMSLAGQFAALRRATYVYRVASSTNWPTARVIDVMRGMIDVLRTASEAGYDNLTIRTLRRFNSTHIQSALRFILESESSGSALPLLETMANLTGDKTLLQLQQSAPKSVDSTHSTLAPAQIDVSVIIPVHNAAAWLHECLLSVVGQSGIAIEIVCVNDGSTDDSLRILREYQVLDARVRIIDQPNGGLSVARNSGLEAARGRYVCFLDSDDYWRLDALGALVARADLDALDVLQFDAVPFADAGASEASWKQYASYYDRSRERGETVSGAELAASQISTKDYRPSACLYLTRTSLLAETGLRFVPGITHEDNPFTFAVLLNAKRAAHMTLGFYARRVRADSIMTSASQERSMRGYFVSYLEMHREVVRHSFDASIAREIGGLLFRVFNNASARFNQLDEEASARVKELVATPDAEIAYSTLVRLREQSRQLSAVRK